MKRNAGLFIQDILENINDIESFSKGLSKNNLISDKLKQKAIIRSLEVIGEAVKNIPISLREKYHNVEWNKISGMRDVIIHGYFRVDLDAIWNVIKNDMPKLKKQIEKIEKELTSKS
ncbi:MAG: DUF86 domain-containing protein [Candidatus Pacearchaeota archaeon]